MGAPLVNSTAGTARVSAAGRVGPRHSRSGVAGVSNGPRSEDAPHGRLASIQRSRLLAAALTEMDERGYASATVAHITSRSRVSRRTFYELFANREECLVAVLEQAVELIEHDLTQADLGGLPWLERVRAGLSVILEFFDREPVLARVCVVHVLGAGSDVLERREAILTRLAGVVDEGHRENAQGAESDRLTAEGVVGAAFTILYTRLLRRDPQPLSDLLGELSGMIVLPYLGKAAARREQLRPTPVVPPGSGRAGHGPAQTTVDPLADVQMRLTYRTARILEGAGEHPGASNRQLADYAGIHDQGQASKLLGRLQRLGLLENQGERERTKGEANAWTLTPKGEQVTHSICVHANRSNDESTGVQGGRHMNSVPNAKRRGGVPTAILMALTTGLLLLSCLSITVPVASAQEGESETPPPGEEAAPSAPVIDSEASENVGVTAATLRVSINAMGAATTYHFEYGTSAAYGAVVPASDASLGAGSTDEHVTWILNDLQPGTAYHYRAVATNAQGTTFGADHVLRTFAALSQTTDTCSNAAVRALQFSSALPECRAYEQVSPVDKGGANIATVTANTQSSTNGDAVKYQSEAAFGTAQGTASLGTDYVGQRGENGWSISPITPEQQSLTASLYTSSTYQYFSEDLTKAVYAALTPVTDEDPNVDGEANLYARTDILTSETGSYTLLTACPVCATNPLPPRPHAAQSLRVAFAGASSDFTHILVETLGNLTSEAVALNPNVPKLYEWYAGGLKLAGILPDGSPANGSVAGAGAGGGELLEEGTWTENTISADGSRVIFTADATNWTEKGNWRAGNLYMRTDGRETVQLNASERTVPDPRGSQLAHFWKATPDGSKVVFSSRQLLTDNATEKAISPESPNPERLYLYDAGAPAGKRLTLIPGFAAVGISDDGSYVYFLGEERLLPSQQNLPPASFGPYLYVWHDGAVRYITTHEDEGLKGQGAMWGEKDRASGRSFRMTADGRSAVFGSRDPEALARLGYDNQQGHGGKCTDSGLEHGGGATEDFFNPCDEVLYYDYDADRLVCVSCAPTGARPMGDAGFSAEKMVDAASVWPQSQAVFAQYLSNALSRDGRFIFFDTPDALVPSDTNHHRDVYEYGTTTGAIHLISGGSCDCESDFADASPDGSNVFFSTPQKLVRADIDASNDLYDARINGGIMAQNVASAASCEGDDCQGPADSAPVFSMPSSSTFDGLGNISPPVKPVIGPKFRKLTTAQKLGRALEACKRLPRARRAACRARARGKLRPAKSAAHASHRPGR